MGEYVHSIDAKGRIILPADFREELGEHFVITKGLDNCLFVRNVTETVRRFRNHPSIALWCARNEGFATNELEYMLAATLAKEDGSRH